MRKIFLCISAVLLLILALAVFVGCGQKEPERVSAGGLVFELDEEKNECSVVDASSELSGEVVIPQTHNGYTVTSIGREAFQRCEGITGIKIPATVKTIDAYAFAYCTSLTDVTIPAGVTVLDNHSFRNCTSLQSVSFEAGSSLTRIGHFAFENCARITSLVIPNNA